MATREYTVDTADPYRRDEDLMGFYANGERTGHGAIGWLPAPRYRMPAAPPWEPTAHGPVVAVLDTEIQAAHSWLPKPGGEEPFVVDARNHGWRPSRVLTPAEDERGGMNYGSHFGHGTFLAGLIRLAAPEARLVSVPVMNTNGTVDEDDVAGALEWLVDRLADYPRLVVLTAFGDAEPSSVDIHHWLKELARERVPVIASAGNAGSEEPRWPAAYATTAPYLTVESVGSRVTPTMRAPYSSYGTWVTRWREGSHQISLMPLATSVAGPDDAGEESARPEDSYAWWSGTSFAAALYAGECARMLASRVT